MTESGKPGQDTAAETAEGRPLSGGDTAVNGGSVGDLELGTGNRGRNDDDRDRAFDRGQGGTLMRHFLQLALTPSALAVGMLPRAEAGALIPGASSPGRFQSTQDRTRTGAVLITAITVAADTHLRATEGATVESVRRLAEKHPRCPKDWTTPSNGGITTKQVGRQVYV